MEENGLVAKLISPISEDGLSELLEDETDLESESEDDLASISVIEDEKAYFIDPSYAYTPEQNDYQFKSEIPTLEELREELFYQEKWFEPQPRVFLETTSTQPTILYTSLQAQG